MFVLNDDLSIYATRGDIVFFSVSAAEDGVPYKFQAGDVVRIKVFGKKDAENVVLQKDFPVTEETEKVEIFLSEEDTKLGEVISKPKDYWYEVELNPFNNPQTIIGYDEDGAKVFRLYPEGNDLPEDAPAIEPEDIPIVDDELDLTSPRPVENQAIARAVVQLRAAFGKTDEMSKDTAAALSVERARINNLVAGGTPDGAEVTDIRVGPDGETYPTAGDAVRAHAKITDTKVDAQALNAGYLSNLFKSSMFEQGVISETNGANSSPDEAWTPYRIRTRGFIPQCEIIKCNPDYVFHVFKYDLDGKYVGWHGYLDKFANFDFTAFKYRVALRTKKEDQNITVSESENIVAYANKVTLLDEIKNTIYTDVPQEMTFERGYIHKELGIINKSEASVSTSNFVKATKGSTVTVRDGFKFRVATYKSANVDSFIECTSDMMAGEVYTFDKDTYFRTYICRSDESASGLEIADNFVFDIPTEKVFVLNAKSVFDKSNKVYFGRVPTKYFKAQPDNGLEEDFGKNTTTSEFYKKFDALVSAYPEYITKKELGVCSDGVQHLYEYTLKPQSDNFDTFKTMPKVLMIGGQHGFEKSNIFGLYYFVKNLLENVEDELISYFRSQVVFKIIPICNPHGFDNNSYLNANGTNLNRNYDTGHFPQYPDAVVGESQYGGAAAFDQPETRIVRDFVNSNKDAFLFLDLHTNGNSSVTSYEQVNWVSLQNTDDEYFYQMHYATSAHFRTLTLHFQRDYNLPANAVIGMQDGEFGSRTKSCTSCEWVYQQNIISATLEGFNGFPGEVPFTMKVYKANAEIIANFIKSVLSNYA